MSGGSGVRARPRGKPARSTAPADHADHAAGASSKPATAEATAPASSGGWKAALDWSAMLLVLVYGGYLAHYYGTLSLPAPQSAHAAGPGGFSEETAYAHVKALTQFGPHPVGSDALDLALEYVLAQVRAVEAAAGPGVDVDVSQFTATGFHRLQGGLFAGKTLIYSNLRSVAVRLSPKNALESAEQNALLVSSHVDTVFTTSGAGDCSSCVASMLELVRALSHHAHAFRHSVIFLFNTGEEEGLDGAHSFLTQHPWRHSVRAFIDLESMGVGGKSILFQAPDQWLVQAFTKAAPRPTFCIAAQDVFHSGFVKSATDFQMYREVAGLSGLDFAFMENGAVYHTKNDKLELLRSGSLQHLGDNVLAFVLEVASSPDFSNVTVLNASELHTFSSSMNMVYFDILGQYGIVYSRDLARVLNTSVIMQVLLILSRSIFPAGLTGACSLLLALLTVLLTWALSLASALVMSFLVPHLGSHAVPYIATPWLVLGLFGAPALVGALVGNSVGHSLLVQYLAKAYRGQLKGLAIKWEAERWLYKAGLVQWVLVLALLNWVGAGSSYLALSWVLFPAAAYGLLNYHSPGRQSRRPVSLLSFWVGVIPPTILSGSSFFMLPQFVISNLVRFDRNPGGVPPWTGNLVVAGLISAIICLWLVYLWPFAHRRGGARWIVYGCVLITAGAVLLVFYQVLPAFTNDVSRAVNVVHVVETTEGQGKAYVSLASGTPGKLDHEYSEMRDIGFHCSKGGPDFATYSVRYGCSKALELDPSLWADRPSLLMEADELVAGVRTSTIRFHAASAHRWHAAINTDLVQGLSIESTDAVQESPKVLVPAARIVGDRGWHHIQFVTDDQGPHNFVLKLEWVQDNRPRNDLGLDLIKVRTDVNVSTPEVAAVLERLPNCSLFGKSTSPYTLAYLDKITVNSI